MGCDGPRTILLNFLFSLVMLNIAFNKACYTDNKNRIIFSTIASHGGGGGGDFIKIFKGGAPHQKKKKKKKPPPLDQIL